MVEKLFVYRGFPCLVVMTDMGHRCGYVGVGDQHPLFGVNYDDITILCHGGLTYGGFMDDMDPQTYWLGFDCAHFGDGKDLESCERLFADKPDILESIRFIVKMWNGLSNHDTIWTLDMVMDECKHIVDQMLEEEEEE